MEKRITPRTTRKINRAPSVARSYLKGSLKQTSSPFVAQAKVMRVIEIIMLLHNSRLTIKELSNMVDQSERTIYRYLVLLQSLGFGVECDFNKRWFLVENSCPLCGCKGEH